MVMSAEAELTRADTQCGRLYRHLSSGHRITPLDAWTQLGIYRVAARIYDLKRIGVEICSRIVVKKNRHDEEFKVKEYWIPAPAGEQTQAELMLAM